VFCTLLGYTKRYNIAYKGSSLLTLKLYTCVQTMYLKNHYCHIIYTWWKR